MGLSYVLDTNVVLYHLSGRLRDPLPGGTLFISIVTEIELFAYKSLSQAERETIESFLSEVKVVDLGRSLKEETIRIRLTGVRLPDAVVAATAVIYRSELLTHDSRLLSVPGLTARAPALKLVP